MAHRKIKLVEFEETDKLLGSQERLTGYFYVGKQAISVDLLLSLLDKRQLEKLKRSVEENIINTEEYEIHRIEGGWP
ncbi:MAG: hypothetical protein QXU98_07290 [Candidatus Parvarchaeota archaeon]